MYLMTVDVARAALKSIPIPVRPIADDEIMVTSVMACSILELQGAVEELRSEVRTLSAITKNMLETLKAFSDLYLELTDETEHRRFLERVNKKIEREAARTHLPLWFWRWEEGQDFKRQLLRRARFLLAERYQPDDVWDLLQEFAREWAKQDLPDETLQKCIEYAARNPGVV